MSRAQVWTFHAGTIFVGGSGLVYGWMRYLAVSEDPYSVVNHPLQPDVQHLHVLTAPLLVFAAGLLWSSHAMARHAAGVRARRSTGILLAFVLFPMILSGYALQVSVDESWRRAWIWVHAITSVVWIVGALMHPFKRARSSA